MRVDPQAEAAAAMNGWEAIPLDELAALQGAKPVECVEELAADIWESPEEIEAFLSDVYANR